MSASLRPARDMFAQVSLPALAFVDVRRQGGVTRMLRTHIHQIAGITVWHVCEEPEDQDDPHAGSAPIQRHWVYPCDVLAVMPPVALPGRLP